IRDLRVQSPSGSLLEAQRRGKEGWEIKSREPVDIAYDVQLDYATGQWPAGNEQSGRLFSNALYTVTRPLFITTSLLTDADLRFHVPNGWHVAAPWEQTAAGVFHTTSADELQNNSV